MKQKVIIYQLLPRLFGNTRLTASINGDITENGCGKFNDISDEVLVALKEFGVTHIWLTGIIRHATLTGYPQYGLQSSHPDIVKGKAGSPYAVSDYYDADPDLAVDIPSRMNEFESLIDRIHENGLKVVIDFVPNHVARDYQSKKLPAGLNDVGEKDNRNIAFSPSNNFYYLPGESFRIRGLVSSTPDRYSEYPARATGNDVFRPDPDINDWYETVKLNYGVDYQTRQNWFRPIPDTWIKMTEILLFWSGKGVDGFRCDMAGMVPVEFWRYSISHVKNEFPSLLFIAELYEPGRYREYIETGCFDYLYDKVGLYDTLRSILQKKSSTRALTGVWQSLEGMDDRMLRFLENHDEQRIASPFFIGDPFKALPAMAISTFLNQGPVLIYSGQEVGEPAIGATGFSGDDGRTTIFDYAVIPELLKWFNGGKCDGRDLTAEQFSLRQAYAGLLHHAGAINEISNGYLYDLMWVNDDIPHRDRIFAFLRYGGTGDDRAILVIVSFIEGIGESLIKIPEHAFETIGFGIRQRLTVIGIEPVKAIPESYLISQVVTVGLKLSWNEYGYGLYSLH
jgi:glycosidase